MINSLTHLKGRSLQARDGLIGNVRDVYFDDRDWVVRYLVVDTGSWLKRHAVLISPGVAGSADWAEPVIPIDLTKEEVRGSPDIDTDKPVTRQHEAALHGYYGWPAYWGNLVGEGGIATPILSPMRQENSSEPGMVDGDAPLLRPKDTHLRSANDTVGYHVAATDGELGHVDEFLIDDDVWRVRYLVIDTRNWLPGRRVLVAPSWVRDIDWSARRVRVDLTRDAIKASPTYDPLAPWDAGYAAELHEHYERPRYADWERDVTAGTPETRAKSQ